MSDNGFYRAFEERYRGSREVIKERLRVYLPFILPFKEIYAESKSIDLGCGRGEWLELMSETGFVRPKGVDLDEQMLSACHERGLSVEKTDAISMLQTLPDGSYAVISAFHVVEHIPFESLQTLIRESLRVLSPGGLLILETPNPENIYVGTSNFYIDPTHQRPIPSQLLLFLAEYYGFARVKHLGLNESGDLKSASSIRLADVLFGVSPDYAIVAQKAASPEQCQLFDQAFGVEYGLTLNGLAQQFDARLAKAERAEMRLDKLRETRTWRFLSWLLG